MTRPAKASRAKPGQPAGATSKRTAPRSASARSAGKAAPATPRDLAHALHGLLHTMQAIQQFEETLCSMAHALERGRPAAALLRYLHHTLQQLPADEYMHEVAFLRDASAL